MDIYIRFNHTAETRTAFDLQYSDVPIPLAGKSYKIQASQMHASLLTCEGSLKPPRLFLELTIWLNVVF